MTSLFVVFDAEAGDWFDQLRGPEPEPDQAPDAAAPAETASIEGAAGAELVEFERGFDQGAACAAERRARHRLEDEDGDGELASGFIAGWNAWIEDHPAPAPPPVRPAGHAVSYPTPAVPSLGHPGGPARRRPSNQAQLVRRDEALRAVFAAGPLTRAEATALLEARGDVSARTIRRWLESASGRFTLPDAAGRFTLAPAA